MEYTAYTEYIIYLCIFHILYFAITTMCLWLYENQAIQ